MILLALLLRTEDQEIHDAEHGQHGHDELDEVRGASGRAGRLRESLGEHWNELRSDRDGRARRNGRENLAKCGGTIRIALPKAIAPDLNDPQC